MPKCDTSLARVASFRLGDRESAALEWLAESRDVTQSDLVRELVLREALRDSRLPVDLRRGVVRCLQEERLRASMS